MSKFEKIFFCSLPILFAIGGLVSMYNDNYWLLKAWFTYKVLSSMYDFIKESIEDIREHSK